MISWPLLWVALAATPCKDAVELAHAARRGDIPSRQLLTHAFLNGSRCAYELALEELRTPADSWALATLEEVVLKKARPWEASALVAAVRINGGVDLSRKVFERGPVSGSWRIALSVLAATGDESAIAVRRSMREKECSLALEAGRLGLAWVGELEDVEELAKGGRPIVSDVCPAGRLGSIGLMAGDTVLGIDGTYCSSRVECWNLLADAAQRVDGFEITIVNADRRLRRLKVPGK